MSTHSDPWRHRCPRGHTSWESRSTDDGPHSHAAESSYYCKTCLKYGHDPHFDQLRDVKANPLTPA